MTHIPQMCFRIHHFRIRHVTSRSQKPSQRSHPQEARSLLQGRDGHTTKKITFICFINTERVESGS